VVSEDQQDDKREKEQQQTPDDDSGEFVPGTGYELMIPADD